MKKIYLIGSLRNPEIPNIGNKLRATGYDVFDDWHAGGPGADDAWQRYEKIRGRSYGDALYSPAAVNIFEFDKHHIEESDIGVLTLPAGKSGHLEFGMMLGSGKKGYILFDGEPERWDVMYQFADGVFFDIEDLVAHLSL